MHRLEHWLSYLQTLYARDNGMNQVGFKGMLLSQFAEIEANGWRIFTDQEIVHSQAATPEYLDVILQKGALNLAIKLKYWRVWYCRFQSARYSLSEQYQQYNRRYRTPSGKRKWWRRHLDRLKNASEQEIRNMDRHDMGRFNPMEREITIAQDKVRRCMITLSQQFPKSYMVGIVIVGVGNRAVREWVNLRETQELMQNGIAPGNGTPVVVMPPADIDVHAVRPQQPLPLPHPHHPIVQQHQHRQQQQQHQQQLQAAAAAHLMTTAACSPPVFILSHPQMPYHQVHSMQPMAPLPHLPHQSQQHPGSAQQQRHRMVQVYPQHLKHDPHQQLQQRPGQSDEEEDDDDEENGGLDRETSGAHILADQ